MGNEKLGLLKGVVDDSPNLGGMSIDSDIIEGEPVGANPVPVNEQGYTAVDGVEEGGPDDTPQVHTLTVTPQTNGVTILSARVYHPQSGWQNKTTAFNSGPAYPTMRTITKYLLNVFNW